MSWQFDRRCYLWFHSSFVCDFALSSLFENYGALGSSLAATGRVMGHFFDAPNLLAESWAVWFELLSYSYFPIKEKLDHANRTAYGGLIL